MKKTEMEKLRAWAKDYGHPNYRIWAEDVAKECNALLDTFEVSDWIPVEERLPEEEGTYLVVDRGNVHWLYFIPNKGWAFGDIHYPDNFEAKNKTVTHWMPLPEPPKE